MNLIAGDSVPGTIQKHVRPRTGRTSRKDLTMSQTLTSLLVHLIFSTRNRVSIIRPEVEPELFAYMGGILKNCESRLLDAGGTSDHVHLLVSQSKKIALSALMKELKKSSSADQDCGKKFSRFPLAGRLRSFFNWPTRPARIEALHREPERGSRHSRRS